MKYSNSHLTKVFSSTSVTKKMLPVVAQQKLGIKTADDAIRFFYNKTLTQVTDDMRHLGVDEKSREIIFGLIGAPDA